MDSRGLVERRKEVIDDKSLEAWQIPEALSRVTDEFLADLYEKEIRLDTDVALVALGGYGRSELCPSSDLDLMLVHKHQEDIDSLADRIWYPLWDEGFKLGHSVRSLEQTLRLAADDLETATSLLNARIVAGDRALVDDLLTRNEKQWAEYGPARLE